MIRTSTFNTSSQLQSSNQTMQKSANIKIMWPGAWAGAQAPWVPRLGPRQLAPKVLFFVFFVVSGFLACFFFFLGGWVFLCFYRKSTSRARFPKPRKKKTSQKTRNKKKNKKKTPSWRQLPGPKPGPWGPRGPRPRPRPPAQAPGHIILMLALHSFALFDCCFGAVMKY